MDGPQGHSPRWLQGLPAPAPEFKGQPEFNFVGGHVEADCVPVEALREAAAAAIAEEGGDLAMYNPTGGKGHAGCRRMVAEMLTRRTGMPCDPEEVLIVSGSLQALDLVNHALVGPGDAVPCELENYGGALSRIRARGAEPVGVRTDAHGMVPEALEETLARLGREGRRVGYVYLIPTVQNPTGTVMPEERRREILEIAARHDVTLFEDDCYADLVFAGGRPKAIRALDPDGRTIYCGTFSKQIAPGLRLGFLVADRPALAQLLALKSDAGTPAIEQMTLARMGPMFDEHCAAVQTRLGEKCAVLCEALDAEFGATAEYRRPEGGIFVWATLPAPVDTTRLAAVAAAEGVAINPGAEWCADPDHGRRSLRLCFANPSEETIRAGVAKLAEICRREFGLPERSANVSRV